MIYVGSFFGSANLVNLNFSMKSDLFFDCSFYFCLLVADMSQNNVADLCAVTWICTLCISFYFVGYGVDGYLYFHYYNYYYIIFCSCNLFILLRCALVRDWLIRRRLWWLIIFFLKITVVIISFIHRETLAIASIWSLMSKHIFILFVGLQSIPP